MRYKGRWIIINYLFVCLKWIWVKKNEMDFKIKTPGRTHSIRTNITLDALPHWTVSSPYYPVLFSEDHNTVWRFSWLMSSAWWREGSIPNRVRGETCAIGIPGGVWKMPILKITLSRSRDLIRILYVKVPQYEKHKHLSNKILYIHYRRKVFKLNCRQQISISEKQQKHFLS